MNKTIFKVWALVLAVVISLIAFSACSQTKTTGLTKEYFEQNKAQVLMNSIDYLKLFSGSENPFEIFTKEISSFSVEFDEPESGLGISTSVNMDKAKNSIDLALTSGEQTIDIGAYFDNKKFALYSDALLGEGKAYGITYDKFDNLIAKFDKSALASVLGLQEGQAAEVCELYGINQQYIDKVAEAYKKFANESKFDYKTFLNEVYAAYEPFYKEVTEETIEINGEKIDALVLEMDYSKEMITIVYDIYFDMCKDILLKTEDLYMAVIPEPLKTETVPDISTEFDMAFETIKAEYEAQLENMDMSGNYKMYIAKDTGLLVKADMDLDMIEEGEKSHVEMIYYVDKGINFYGTMTVGEEIIDMSGKMGYTEDESKHKWFVEMNMLNKAIENALVDTAFEINKADGTFNLYVKADQADEEVVKANVGGNISYTKDSFEITVDSATASEYGYETETPINLNVKLGTKAQVTELGEYKDILELTEDEIYGIVGQFIMTANSITSMFPQPEFAQPEPDFYDEYYYDDVYGYDYDYEYDYDYDYDYDYSGYEY